MNWRRPDDLELIAECETMPELEIIKGLLSSGGIEVMTLETAEGNAFFSPRNLLQPPSEKPRPFKLLVHPDDAEEAREVLQAVYETTEETDE